MIPGTCPDCGAKRPLPDYLADAAAREALAAALTATAPVLGRLLVRYLDLHSPPGRAMSMGKLQRLVIELSALLQAGTITRAHETRPAPPAAWQQGLETVLAQRDAGSLALPLKGHGYLLEIIHRNAGRAQAKQQAASTPLHPSHRPFTPPAQDGQTRPTPANPGPSGPSGPSGQNTESAPQPIAQHLAGLRAALVQPPTEET